MDLNHLKGIVLSSSALIMQMRDCSNISTATCSSWSRRNIFMMALTGRRLTLKTTKTALIFSRR
uniref:Uncharacterized protein n=1 Tax=Rhizophora mucronata TaxID=61149 RepID=A0A2P2LEZ4_RHIMU